MKGKKPRIVAFASLDEVVDLTFGRGLVRFSKRRGMTTCTSGENSPHTAN
jgi:hypothetical protein